MRGAQCECGMLRYVTSIGHVFKKYVTLRAQCESGLSYFISVSSINLSSSSPASNSSVFYIIHVLPMLTSVVASSSSHILTPYLYSYMACSTN